MPPVHACVHPSVGASIALCCIATNGLHVCFEAMFIWLILELPAADSHVMF